MAKAYIVEKSAFDASRPFVVVATFRSFNKVVGRYATKQEAGRRACDLNRATGIDMA